MWPLRQTAVSTRHSVISEGSSDPNKTTTLAGDEPSDEEQPEPDKQTEGVYYSDGPSGGQKEGEKEGRRQGGREHGEEGKRGREHQRGYHQAGTTAGMCVCVYCLYTAVRVPIITVLIGAGWRIESVRHEIERSRRKKTGCRRRGRGAPSHGDITAPADPTGLSAL